MTSPTTDYRLIMNLHIRDISKTYLNGVQALKDVSLTIPAGSRATTVQHVDISSPPTRTNWTGGARRERATAIDPVATVKARR